MYGKLIACDINRKIVCVRRNYSSTFHCAKNKTKQAQILSFQHLNLPFPYFILFNVFLLSHPFFRILTKIFLSISCQCRLKICCTKYPNFVRLFQIFDNRFHFVTLSNSLSSYGVWLMFVIFCYKGFSPNGLVTKIVFQKPLGLVSL
jgi:hypothetical protein